MECRPLPIICGFNKGWPRILKLTFLQSNSVKKGLTELLIRDFANKDRPSIENTVDRVRRSMKFHIIKSPLLRKLPLEFPPRQHT